jgi:hypothetical protein
VDIDEEDSEVIIVVLLGKKNSDKMITVMEVVRWLRSDYSGIGG